MENYKQKYETALETARKINSGEGVAAPKDWSILEVIFPELRKSKNERIKNNIIKLLRFVRDTYHQYSDECNEAIEWLKKQSNDITCLKYNWIREELIHFLETCQDTRFVGNRKRDEWIAWLEKQHTPTKDELEALRIAAYEPTKNWSEKLQSLYEKLTHTEQGEQTHTNKEPKFKVGDWVVDGCYDQIYQVGQIVEVKRLDDETYGYTLDDGTYFNGYFEEKFHLWSIQDAKDGDILEFGDHGRLVTGILSFVNKTTGKVDVSCLLEGDKFKVGVFYNLDTVKPHPATKEQRDTLFTKMKEAGYEWDSNKKKKN